jgi:Glycosyltransferases involved in cell wall biogenesis
MDKLFIVMPAYNERDNIAAVVEQWHPITQFAGEGSKLVIFNDGSKDDTLAVCRELEKKYPNLIVVDKPNSGHGATCLHAYHYALEKGADYIFQTDSDGQTNPEEFKSFWGQRNNYDLCIGVRKKRQDGMSRIVVTKTLKLVIYYTFGIWVRDANTPFRLVPARHLKDYLKIIPQNFFLANVLMTVIAVYRGDRIYWQEITFRPRQAGTNSINLKRIFKIGLKALHDFSEAKKLLITSYGRRN